MLPPVPPRVKLGRMMAGIPVSATIALASSRSWATPDAGTPRPIRSMAARNSSRFSAFWIAFTSAPISSTPWRSSTPTSASDIARLSAVCPPIVGSTASGFSARMIFSTASMVIGSI